MGSGIGLDAVPFSFSGDKKAENLLFGETIEFFGAPAVTRTRGAGIRNPLLYPPELRGQHS